MVELSVPGQPQATPQITLDKVQAVLRVPVGAASPLWFMFAGAATAGMAFWWMTRWARPQNLEAMMAAAVPTPEPPTLPAIVAPTPLVAAPAVEPRSFAAELEEEPEPVVELTPPPAPIASEPLTGAALVAEVARLTGLAPPEAMPDFEPEPPKAAKKAAKKPPTQN